MICCFLTLNSHVVHLHLNISPELLLKELIKEFLPVVGIYLSMMPKTLTGALTYVPKNWLLTHHEMRNEMCLASAGLSCRCNKGNFPLSNVRICFFAKVLTFFLFHLLPDIN